MVESSGSHLTIELDGYDKQCKLSNKGEIQLFKNGKLTVEYKFEREWKQ